MTVADPGAGIEGASEGSPGRRRIARTFFLALLLVTGALVASAAVELVLRYRENVDAVVALQQEMAQGAAFKIRQFIGDIEKSMRSSRAQCGSRRDGPSIRIVPLRAAQAPEDDARGHLGGCPGSARPGGRRGLPRRNSFLDEDLRDQSASIAFHTRT